MIVPAELKTLSGRRPSQRADELYGLIHLMQAEGCRSYLEIGARHGDTFHTVMGALPWLRGVALDLPGGNWGAASSRRDLRRAVRQFRKRANVIFGNSRDPAIVQAVAGFGPYDAILIDGDHLYDGVAADWSNYGPLGRLVAFHDIAGTGQATHDARQLPVEVPRLWAELKPSHRHVEFIGAGSSMGIGVLWTARPSIGPAAIGPASSGIGS